MRKKIAVGIAFLVMGGGVAFAEPFGDPAGRFLELRPGGSAPPSARDFGGDRCEDAEGQAGIWWGRFAGGRKRLGSGSDSSFQTHTSQGCFSRRGDCEAWLLALKTKYSAKPVYNQCRRGYEPGAPVPPWWAPKA